MLKSLRLMLVLSLLMPFAHDAAGRTPDGSTPTARPLFKSGFSSQRPTPAPKPSYKQGSSSGGASGGFGSFSSQRSAPPPSMPSRMPAPDRAASRDGGFGSFSGGRADTAHRSESASSRELTRRQAEENALRTLEERRARTAARTAERDPERSSRPGQYERDQRDDRDYRDYRAPAPSYPPEVARQGGGGLGNVVAGAVIANAINRHANASNNSNNANNAGNRQAAPDNAAPGNDWGLGPKDGHVAGTAAGPGGTGTTGSKGTAGNQGQTGGASFARVFLWLGLLALLGAGGYFLWRRVRRKRDADKPNYSFERN